MSTDSLLCGVSMHDRRIRSVSIDFHSDRWFMFTFYGAVCVSSSSLSMLRPFPCILCPSYYRIKPTHTHVLNRDSASRRISSHPNPNPRSAATTRSTTSR